MSKVQITGKVVAGQPLFDNGSFRKQTLIIEVVNGTYTSYFPIEFHQQDVDTLLPQVQLNGTYQFDGWLQGSRNQMQDRNGQPTAYLSFKVGSVAPAQSAGLPPTTPSTAPQQQGGYVGPSNPAPAAQPSQGFGTPNPNQPAQGFNNPPAQGFGNAPAPASAPSQGFGGNTNNNAGFGQNQ